jgi:pimeloyl-ACP methyl ester carboxylesterase
MNKFKASDGEHIYVHVQGEGPPIIFLHGWTSSHKEWLDYAEQLSTDHQCYCWDARGHGGHQLQVDELPTVQRMAQDLHDLINHFQLQ